MGAPRYVRYPLANLRWTLGPAPTWLTLREVADRFGESYKVVYDYLTVGIPEHIAAEWCDLERIDPVAVWPEWANGRRGHLTPGPTGQPSHLDTSWVERGACRGVSTDLFFPERGESPAAAKAVCATCPVRVECLDYALVVLGQSGIWGGQSERQRRQIRSRRFRVVA